MTAVPMTADEQAKFTAIQTAMAAMKADLDDAQTQAQAIFTNANALMAALKTAGRVDAYTAAFGTKGDFVRLAGECLAMKGEVMQAHYRASVMLQQFYTDAATVVTAFGR